MKKESLAVTVSGKNIYEITAMSIRNLDAYLKEMELTEQQHLIGYQVDVRRFTAACAGTGKLKVCRFKLGTADSEFIHRVFLTGERDGVIPVFLLVKLRFNRFHDESLFRGGAYIGADIAAVAVFRTDNDSKAKGTPPSGRTLTSAHDVLFSYYLFPSFRTLL